MDINEEVYTINPRLTNDQLNEAIDTAARFSGSVGHESRSNMMLAHLQKLLDIQLQRAKIINQR